MNDTKLFFVVGAQKSGTSALFDTFINCPDFKAPKKKEFHLLAEREPISKVEYLSALGVDSGITGDFSPSYLYSPYAAQNIKTYFPEAKIIIVLRNPMERAYSNMVHCVRLGKELKIDLNILISGEQERVANQSALFHYISKGFYFNQVKRFLDTFPKDQVMIIMHSDLLINPEGTLALTMKFVGLDPLVKPVLKKVNTGHIGRYKFSSSIVRLYNKLNISSLFPEIMKSIGKKIFLQDVVKPPKSWFLDMNRKIYLEDIMKLEKLIGRNLSNWYE
jgi:hypothetical protein